MTRWLFIILAFPIALQAQTRFPIDEEKDPMCPGFGHYNRETKKCENRLLPKPPLPPEGDGTPIKPPGKFPTGIERDPMCPGFGYYNRETKKCESKTLPDDLDKLIVKDGTMQEKYLSCGLSANAGHTGMNEARNKSLTIFGAKGNKKGLYVYTKDSVEFFEAKKFTSTPESYIQYAYVKIDLPSQNGKKVSEWVTVSLLTGGEVGFAFKSAPAPGKSYEEPSSLTFMNDESSALLKNKIMDSVTRGLNTLEEMKLMAHKTKGSFTEEEIEIEEERIKQTIKTCSFDDPADKALKAKMTELSERLKASSGQRRSRPSSNAQ